MSVRVVIAAFVATLALAGCGDDATQVPAGSGADETIYVATGTVLESPQHGPQLCLGAVALSLPPQCGGPDIVNWKWDDAPAKETNNGVTWGTYLVVGTFDGKRFTLTEPPRPPDVSTEMSTMDFSSPCSEPAGDWQVLDATKATDEALNSTLEAVNSDPQFAGGWIDQNGGENDPERMVLNLRFTSELARHEREARETWGGALCVTEAEHSLQKLRQIQDELTGRGGFMSIAADQVRNVVDVSVVLDRDGELQREMDERYGEGVVEVESALKPVE